MAQLLARTLTTALAGCLLASCDAEDRPADERELSPVLLATAPELREAGLVKVLVARFEAETNIKVELCDANVQAHLSLVRVDSPQGAADPSDAARSDREILWTTLLILGPPEVEKRSYGERNYASWGRPKSPLGNAVAFITRSSASQLFKEIGLSGHPVLACGSPSWIRVHELKLWGAAKGRRSSRVETGEPMARTLELASDKSAYVLSDAATYLRLRRDLRLDVVLARDQELRISYAARLPESKTRSAESSQAARRFFEWLESDRCTEVVRGFRIDGERPFYVPDEELSESLRGRLDISLPEFEAEDR